jgi:hypothetical protein
LLLPNASLYTLVSFNCYNSQMEATDDGDDQPSATNDCTLLDSIHMDKVYTEFVAGRVNMTATAKNPNFISRLIGTDHYISGVKYRPSAAADIIGPDSYFGYDDEKNSSDHGRFRNERILTEMRSPTDPDVSSSGVDCIAVDGDDVYDSVMCLNVKEGFMKTYLDIYDEYGMLGVIQGVTSWALEGGIAFTSDVSVVVKGGYETVLNVSASEDYQNASLVFQYTDNGVEKVYTNAFTEWHVDPTGENVLINYYLHYNESIDVSGGFTTLGELNYGGNEYHLAVKQHVDMNHAFYDMSAYVDGNYGGSWSDW